MIRSQSGFTLVELMTSITIIGILSGIVVAFGVNGLANYNFSYNRGVLLDQAYLGLRGVGEVIQQSASADDHNRIEDTNGPGAPANLFGWTSDDDTLILASAAEDNSGNILFQDEAQYITYKNNVIYYLSGNSLKRRVLAADIANNKTVTTCPVEAATSSCPADVTVLENVDNFEVKYYDSQNQEVDPDEARSIGLEVSLSKNVQGRSITADYQTRMVFRND